MSLRVRLALFGAAVVALALVLFGVLVYTLLARSVTNNQDTQLRARARQAASATNIADLSPHPLIAAADLKNSTDVYVEVLDPSGVALYATAMLDGAPPPVPDGLLPQATAHNGAFATEGDAGRGTELRLYAQPFAGGYVIAGQSTRVPASNLSGVVVFLIISAVPALLAALIASWLVAGRALRPLRIVASTAGDIASTKDFSRRLTVGRRGDEVALLSAGFNRMLAALEGALDAQRRFVADASHELRTPPVHLAPLAEEVVRQAATVHADLNLTTELSDLAVYGDEDALRQLLWILLDNAGRHARSKISVGVRAEDGWARLIVADDGPGVPPDERERVFERFYKADPSRRHGGAGLGLAIARWIADQHNGRIVAADGPDGGAGFFVDLPLLSRS
ncbi:MAG: HAMP domain-containing histidine kinase [Chloroflexi bacterium]|nr:MAG: HAMP domain-containing histidine kinase [Chloroflexota bacterium]